MAALRRLAPVLHAQRGTLLRSSPPLAGAAAAGDTTALLSHHGTRALSGLAASRGPGCLSEDGRGFIGASSARAPLCSPLAASLLQQRRMAAGAAQQKGASPPAQVAGMGSGASRQLTVTSPNVIREPYTGPSPPLQVRDVTSREGLTDLYKRLLGRAKNVYTLAKVKKDIPGWSLSGFKEETTSLYRLISEGVASGKVTDIRRHLTDLMSGELKRQVSVDQVTIVQGRLAVPSGMGKEVSFAQFTVEFKSQQRFAAYNSKGDLVAGSEDNVIPVRELWVFERSLVQTMPNKAWRLAGRLALPGKHK